MRTKLAMSVYMIPHSGKLYVDKTTSDIVELRQVNEHIRKWNIGMAQKEGRQDRDGLYA